MVLNTTTITRVHNSAWRTQVEKKNVPENLPEYIVIILHFPFFFPSFENFQKKQLLYFFHTFFHLFVGSFPKKKAIYQNPRYQDPRDGSQDLKMDPRISKNIDQQKNPKKIGEWGGLGLSSEQYTYES